jgi:predicted dehydrogenase
VEDDNKRVYRVAVLGCRSRGAAAARAYHQHPRTEVVGLCDLLPERLEALGGELGVGARFADLDEMIRQTHPDIVAIPTGTEFHYDLAMRVLEHGCHIDIEKPLCTSLDQADRVIAKAAAQRVLIAVHHQGRVGAPMRAVRLALKEGRIGRLRHIQGCGKGYYGGYGLMNIGTHTVNNMIGLAGHCRSVSAQILVDGRQAGPGDVVLAAGGMGLVAGEHISAAFEFEGSVTGVLLQHRFPQVDSTAYALEVFGTEGRLFWKSDAAWWLPQPHWTPGAGQWQPLELESLDGYDTQGTAAEADYAFADEFVRALDQGREHECGGAEGRHVMEILMGILAAGACGKSIRVPQEDRGHPLEEWLRQAGADVPQPGPRPYGEWLAAQDRRLGRPSG